MSNTVISVENLSKSYRLGMIGGATLKEDFSRWWAKMRGKPDPLLKIGQEHHTRLIGEQFWALQDINFQVTEGEVLGIIGRNGAGKSTLLKILSQVTAPTSGEIKIKGRIASLLEVGTGFHAELTGRENIFLNGAILGMTKGEIRRKLDEIIDFSGIEEFIDTPVKRYSSGMYVRLAFAVAAHLEPEILIVDEVLAVGDAEFQKKCLGKMQDVSQKLGRTILFVSHNLLAVRQLCGRAVLMQNGKLVTDGLPDDVINHYTEIAMTGAHQMSFPDQETGFVEVRIVDVLGEPTVCVSPDKPACVELRIRIKVKTGVTAGFTVFNQSDAPLFLSTAAQSGIELKCGEHFVRVRLPVELLQPGRYRIEGAVWDASEVYHKVDNLCNFEVMPVPGNDKYGRTSSALFVYREPWEFVSDGECAAHK
jgi:lipopolysaccharide transport system ATP-binding protein